MLGRWTVASDRVTRLALPTGYRYGRMLAASRPRTLPERFGHAVVPGSRVTLCGRPVVGLHRFDAFYFDTLGHHLRCPTCDEAAGHPHAHRSR